MRHPNAWVPPSPPWAPLLRMVGLSRSCRSCGELHNVADVRRHEWTCSGGIYGGGLFR